MGYVTYAVFTYAGGSRRYIGRGLADWQAERLAATHGGLIVREA